MARANLRSKKLESGTSDSKPSTSRVEKPEKNRKAYNSNIFKVGEDAITEARRTRAATLRSSSCVTCVVCLDRKLYDDFPRRQTASGCSHKPQVCSSCLAQSIKTQFQNKIWDHIDCPECSVRLTAKDVALHADEVTLEKYSELSQHYQRCRHSRCKSGRICNPSTEQFIICPKQSCQRKTCTRCDDKWHEGLSCAEFQQQKAENKEKAANNRWLNSNTKCCPNKGCGVKIEKDGGCDYMHCSKCNLAFCYRCLAGTDLKLMYVIHQYPCVPRPS